MNAAITEPLLALAFVGGWLPIATFAILTVVGTYLGVHHLNRAHHGLRHDDRAIDADLADFAAFRTALRPTLAPMWVDDRPSVVVHPTGSAPSQR